MNDIFLDERIKDACRRYRVKRLFVFGSHASNHATDSSDVDLLVEFDRQGFEGAFDQYMDFKEEMESIFGTTIDLITGKRYRNPIFRNMVEQNKKLIYAA